MNEELKYIESLNQKELKSYHIAKEHLGSSFELQKSNGFIKWLLRSNLQKSLSDNSHEPTNAVSIGFIKKNPVCVPCSFVVS